MIRFLAVCISLSAAWAQSSAEGLTARQLFYDEGKPAATAKPVAQAKQTTARPPATTRPAGATRPAPPKAEVVAKADVPKKASTPASSSTPVSRPAQLPVVAVSHTPVAVRYSLVKLENGAEVEVPATHTFRSGDQVRLKVEANQRGYLYLAVFKAFTHELWWHNVIQCVIERSQVWFDFIFQIPWQEAKLFACLNCRAR